MSSLWWHHMLIIHHQASFERNFLNLWHRVFFTSVIFFAFAALGIGHFRVIPVLSLCENESSYETIHDMKMFPSAGSFSWKPNLFSYERFCTIWNTGTRKLGKNSLFAHEKKLQFNFFKVRLAGEISESEVNTDKGYYSQYIYLWFGD